MADNTIVKRRVLPQSMTTFLGEEDHLEDVACGRRKISGSLPLAQIAPQTPSSSNSNTNVLSASFASSHLESQILPLEVPENLESPESLEYLGLNLPASIIVWDLIDFDREDQLAGVLEQIGISKELAEVFHNPHFAAVRNTASLSHWLVDTFEMRWDVLTHELEAGAQTQLDQSKHLREGNLNGTLTPSAGEDTNAAPKELSDHTMLWRTGRKEECVRTYDARTGEVNLNFSTFIMGDFAPRQRVYFTPQTETADKYLEFAKARSQLSQLCVLQFAVPNVFIDSLKKTILRCTGETADTWRQTLYHSRNGKRLPRTLSHVVQSELLIGNIASRLTFFYSRIGSYDNVKTAEALTLNLQGTKVHELQSVFQNAGEDRLGEECKGKAWQHNLSAFQAVLSGK